MVESQYLPLANVRVLDLSRVLAGPLAAMTLGDLGAKVIKVERPGVGDDTRGWGPPFDTNGQAAYFLAANRNKLSVALDLANPTDQGHLLALIDGADIVIDNFLPGMLARHGIDVDTILARNAKLIWCTVGGFDRQPDRPGYDFVVQAESGWMAITGPVHGEPFKVGVALADVLTAKDAVAAILAALAGQTMTGPLPSAQRRLRVTLAHSATAALVNVAQNALVTGQEPARWGNAHPNLVPYELFSAADRPIVIAVGTDAQWRALTECLALPALRDDHDLRRNAGRVANRSRVVEAIADRIRERPATAWVAELTAAGVPCGLVRSVSEAVADLPSSPAWGIAPSTGGTVRHAPPGLDAHGERIRAGYWSAFDHLPILP